MEGKSCFFIGHREADERLLPRLKLEIDRLIVEENVRYFYVSVTKINENPAVHPVLSGKP